MNVTPVSRQERIRAIKDAFHFLLWVAVRQFSHLLQPFGLTFPQFFALAALVAHKQTCTMRDLTSVTFQDPPTMTGIVDRLVRMQLVQRSRSETDRRVVLVQATPAGIELVDRINQEIMQDALADYTTLTDDELTTFEQLLRYKLRMYLGQYKSLPDGELDTEIERLKSFMSDPIGYMKMEDKKSS
jgi:DNA-binding MarR family transcriptional regulator